MFQLLLQFVTMYTKKVFRGLLTDAYWNWTKGIMHAIVCIIKYSAVWLRLYNFHWNGALFTRKIEKFAEKEY